MFGPAVGILDRAHDLTVEAMGLQGRTGETTFAARDPMVMALVEDATALIELAGAQTKLHPVSGAALVEGDPVPTARASFEALMLSWKTAQTLNEFWSGVASAARETVEVAQQVSPHIVAACTRKTTPRTPAFVVPALKGGRRNPHRLRLSS